MTWAISMRGMTLNEPTTHHPPGSLPVLASAEPQRLPSSTDDECDESGDDAMA